MFKSGVLAVGADPEVFFYTKDGIPYSAEGLLGGTKFNPKPIEKLPAGFFIQEDNVAGEFNIPPCSKPDEFSSSIAKALSYIQKQIRAKNLDIRYIAAAHFPEEQLRTPHAQTLGCEPDFNAWLKQMNAPPRPPETLRTAAGHVHISWQEPTQAEQDLLIRYLDLVLGVPSILATDKNERRTLYGRAGSFRPKDYGVEYRTLDNFWIETHEDRVHVFNTVKHAVATLQRGSTYWLDNLEEFGEEIQGTINEYDKDLALHLCHNFDLTPFSHV